MALLLSVFGYFFASTFLQVLGTPEEMMGQAEAYLQINFIGIWCLFGYNFISTVLRSFGDSKTTMRFVLIAVLLNILLDPLCIAVSNLWIEWAAYATILAMCSDFLYGLFSFFIH